MYFPDLGRECQVDQGPYVRAIGWLSASHPYPKGGVTKEFVDALQRNIDMAWQPVAAGGRHTCEFCKSNPAKGGGNVWIPGNGVVYVAPELVLHYIDAHGYKPPDEFVDATLACPEQKSDEYRNMMRALPARWLKFLDV